MFEENKNINDFDLMMKSILDEGREEVPAHVWEGISEGLDKAAGRKTVVLWWRRAAIGAAAAAVVAFGVIFSNSNESGYVPQSTDSDMIAVVEPVAETYDEQRAEEDIRMEEVLIAEVRKPSSPADDAVPETAADAMKVLEKEADETEVQDKPADIVTERNTGEAKNIERTEPAGYFSEEWVEEEKKERRGVAFSVSGIAGTNNAQSQNRIGPMKSPTLSLAPKKTGVEETSTRSSYGIPLSFGAGVRFDLSDRWSIGTGINYTLLSRQFHGKYTKVNASGSIESTTSSDIRNTQHYIGIPVNAFYEIIDNGNINLYAYAGGTAEKCISDKYNVLSTSIVHKENAEGIQLSANIGLGVEFMLGKNLGLYVDPSLRYYFDNGQPKSIRTVQPLMLGFEMGFRARL